MDDKERFAATQTLREEFDKRGYETVELVGRQDFLQRVNPKHISALEKALRNKLGEDIQAWKKNFQKEEAPEILAYHMDANNTKVNSLELVKMISKNKGLNQNELDWLKLNKDIRVEIFLMDNSEIVSSYNISIN